MVLVSLKSSEANNGYSFSNNFPEALVIDPNASVSVVNIVFERANSFNVNTTNNFFQVRVGDDAQNIVQLGIPTGDYSGAELAILIQNAFNRRFLDEGFVINCSYADERFTIEALNIPIGLKLSNIGDVNATQGSEYGGYTADTATLINSGVTQGESNYVWSETLLETTETFPVNKTDQGPGSWTCRLDSVPPTGPAGVYGNGLSMAITYKRVVEDAGYTKGTKAVCDPAQISADTPLTANYFTKADDSTHLQIYCGGTTLVYDAPLALTAGSLLQVGYGVEDFFVRYQLANTKTWISVALQNPPTKFFRDIQNDECVALLGTDFVGTTLSALQLTETGQVQMANEDFIPSAQNGNTTFTSTGTTAGYGEIIRTAYNGGASEDIDSGVVSQKFFPNEASEVDFNVGTSYDAGIHLDFGIVDETARQANVSAGASLGTTSFATGVTADGGGGAVLAPNKNPFLAQFVLRHNHGLQVRDNQNTNVVAYTTLVSHADMAGATNLAIKVKVNAVSNTAVLSYTKNVDDAGTPYLTTTQINLPRYNTTKTPDHISGYGTSLSKSTGGYTYFFNYPNWEGLSTATQPNISSVACRVAEGQAKNLVQIFPNANASQFGKLTGFDKSVYQFSHFAVGQTGDAPEPRAGATTDFDDVIQINVPTLSVRSLTGQKFSANATLADAPQGSLGGISRMVAQLPRANDNDGIDLSKFGPFYYDYFPYNVPLKNACEMSINDLQITITNRDGSFATDIAKTTILLSITQVESFGQSRFEPTIGAPAKMPQTASQRNILNSQMTNVID